MNDRSFIQSLKEQKTMTTTTQTQCACSPCTCNVSPDSAVEKDGKYYCCEACANGHPDSTGCGNSSCNCGG